MKKKSIIDCCFIYDEIEMLKFRISELYNFVDHFIVVESNRDFAGGKKDFNFEITKIFFQDWSDKIIYLKCDLESNENDFDIEFQISKIQSIILEHLKGMNLDYEDYILFSEVDELPPVIDLNEFDKILSFEPIAFLQKNFICSTEYVNKENHLGTFCFTFSQLLRDEKIIENLYFNKNIVYSIHYRIVEGGFHFSKFDKDESIIKKIKLIEKKEITQEDINNFKNTLKFWDDNYSYFEDYEGSLPKNIKMIQNDFFKKIEPKKSLIILNYNQNLINASDFVQYDMILNFNFTKSYEYPHNFVVSENLTNFNIYIPNIQFYKSQKFELEFGLNEIKNILRKFNFLNQDTFEFCIYDEILHIDKPLIYSWFDIKNNRIYELLKNPS